MSAIAAAVIAGSVGCASLAVAQEVRGIARAGATGETTPPPSAETSVVLIDSVGNVVVGTITDADGRYALRAPIDGRFRVRARRIGFAPDSSAPMSLRRGERITFDPVLHLFATRLAAVRVDEAQRCRISPDAGTLAHRLWSDAQSVLTATVVAADGNRSGFVLRRTERDLAPDGSTIRESRTWDTRTLSSEPYASIPAESLAVHGFVVPMGQALVYYAPDARTLIADAFARGHCFRPTTRADRPSEIGLAFTPVRTTRVRDASRRDVSGVLWLDRATGQMHDLEFTYGPEGSSGRTSPVASGRVHYRPLQNGTWMVDHWLIRMPVVTIRTVMAPRAVGTVGDGTTLEPDTVAAVTAVWEGGGDVIGTFTPSDSTAGALASFGSVRGRFVDTLYTAQGIRTRGVAGIRVQLIRRSSSADKTVHAATTDSTGAFAFDSVDAGAYTIRASGGPIDTLDIDVPEREIAVSAATSQSLLTVIPSPAAALRRLCAERPGDHLAAVHGVVRDAAARPVARARVTIAWFDAPDTRQTHFVASTQTRTTVSGPDGAYVVCGLPREHAITITASLGTVRSAPVALDPSRATLRLAMIELRSPDRRDPERRRDAGNRITGTVTDSAGRPVHGAMVRIDSMPWSTVREDGGFGFSPIQAGRHVLEARALGFAPHAWFVTVHSERPSLARLTLGRVTILGGVEVTAVADTTPLLPAGFVARRASNSGGSFLDQTQIEQRGAVHVSDLLRSMPGVALVPVTGSLGNTEYVLVMRGIATARAETCPIQYYVDGHPAPSSADIDRLLSPRDLAAVEVFPGASQVPPEFKGASSRCGVIALWTRGQ